MTRGPFLFSGLAVLLASTSGLAQSPAAASETRLSAVPVVIGPGIISTAAEEFKVTMSPDHETMLYVVTEHLFHHMQLAEAHRHGKEWGQPEIATFSGIWRDGDPSFAPDGRSLFFISNRPMPGDPPGVPRKDYNIWKVTRSPSGSWGEPTALDRRINTDTAEFAPSLTASGTLYFSRGDNILLARKEGSGFSAPELFPIQGGDPSIAPDERMIVFDADGVVKGDADLFVSCRTSSGWSPPSRLADPVSSPFEEGDPSINADGHTLTFFSRRAPTVDRAPRSSRPSYAQIHKEAIEDIYNGSRNLFEVDMAGQACPRQ